MCSIYTINIGANTNHSSQARSPIFHNNDKSFQFVSFCTKEVVDNPTPYPQEMLPFTSPHKDDLKTHNDPNWKELTYGDDCSNLRARALKNVKHGDILLFWGLLYNNECPDRKNCSDRQGACWKHFSSPLDKNKGWYLLGALRVEKVVVDKDTLGRLSPKERSMIEKNVVVLDGLSSEELCRIKKNAHFDGNKITSNHWIFLGDKDKKHSRLFDKAVALWVPKSNPQSECKWENSLMYKNFHSAMGQQLSLNGSGPLWSRSLRPCRKMWDLNDPTQPTQPTQRDLAECVRDAIQKDNKDFDLLRG